MNTCIIKTNTEFLKLKKWLNTGPYFTYIGKPAEGVVGTLFTFFLTDIYPESLKTSMVWNNTEEKHTAFTHRSPIFVD